MNAVSGRKLLKIRKEKLSMSRPALAKATNRSAESIRLYERDQINAVPGDFLRALAELLGEPFGVLQLKLMPDPGDVSDTATTELLIKAGVAVRKEPRGDLNLTAQSLVRVPEIPLFDLPLAAGGWNDVPEPFVVEDAATQLLGRFRVRLIGDSMMPIYPDGQVVEFQYVPGTETGRDYYVQLKDGRATFKRLKSTAQDGLVLVARNHKKYPDPLRVPYDQVARFALAIAKVELLKGGQ